MTKHYYTKGLDIPQDADSVRYPISEGYTAKVENGTLILVPKESEDERIREEIVSFIRAFWVDHRDSVPQASKWLDWLEKQKEQKLEWSEEDEEIFNLTITHLLNYAYSNNPIYCEEAEKCVAWLKSLKNRGNSTKSNTNSHREFSGSFMDYLDRNRPRGKMCLSNGECKNIYDAFQRKDWAMLLRYAKKYGVLESWRPSEEQMEALKCAVLDVAKFSKRGGRQVELENEPYYSALHSLCCDLEKLM